MTWIDALAGALTGILSGWGIGGGSLLMLYMGAVRGIGQQAVQGINLAYFLPVSAGALVGHIKSGLIEKNAFLITASSGVASAVLAASLANVIDAGVMQKFFGAFMLIIGAKEVFHKKDK